MRSYVVCPHSHEKRCVEAWSSYQLQFSGERQHAWQADFASDLRTELRSLGLKAGELLAGAYATADPRSCDAENRLFTNPGAAVLGSPTAISWERSNELPREPPAEVQAAAGYVHYYRYCVDASWEWWEKHTQLASWTRIPLVLKRDGSARPIWLSMRLAALRGTIQAPALTSRPRNFGILLTIHPTRSGPRSAAAASEALVDGVIAAFHGAEPRYEVASLVAARIAAKTSLVSRHEAQYLASTDGPGPIFPTPPFTPAGSVSPADDLCDAGAVVIGDASRSPVPELSGELFTLQRVPRGRP